MGQGILSRLRGKKEINVLIVGLDYAGKTTLLHTLQREVSVTIPTIGMTMESVHCKNFHITSWDVGGRGMIRPLYRHFYPLMDAVLFMVDSADEELLETAGDEFRRLAEEDELQAVPLAVLANKQDLPAVASLPAVADALGLEQARRHRSVEIFATSCVTGEGVGEVLEWVERQLTQQQQLQHALLQPAKKAVPPSLTSLCASVSSALKLTLGSVRDRLCWS